MCVPLEIEKKNSLLFKPSAGTCGWTVYGMGSVIHSGGDESIAANEEERQCQQRQRDGESKKPSHQSKEGSVQQQKEGEGEFEETAGSGKRAKHDDEDSLEDNRRKQHAIVGMEENDPQLFRILQVK